MVGYPKGIYKIMAHCLLLGYESFIERKKNYIIIHQTPILYIKVIEIN